MALQKQMELTNGIVCANAYHKICNVSITKSKESLFIKASVKSFADKNARDCNKEYLKVQNYDIQLPIVDNVQQTNIELDLTKDNNLFNIVYTALKSFTEFENAGDV